MKKSIIMFLCIIAMLIITACSNSKKNAATESSEISGISDETKESIEDAITVAAEAYSIKSIFIYDEADGAVSIRVQRGGAGTATFPLFCEVVVEAVRSSLDEKSITLTELNISTNMDLDPWVNWKTEDLEKGIFTNSEGNIVEMNVTLEDLKDLCN